MLKKERMFFKLKHNYFKNCSMKGSLGTENVFSIASLQKPTLRNINTVLLEVQLLISISGYDYETFKNK